MPKLSLKPAKPARAERTSRTISLRGVTWFKQAGVRIRRRGANVYVDPWGLYDRDEADLVLITHEHYDHYSPDDLGRIRQRGTKVVVPSSMASKARDFYRLVKPGDTFVVDGVKVKVVPSYNRVKAYHPRNKDWVGYVIEVDGVTYYHAGDTDVISEMETIQADVAFLPCGGTYTMNGKEAAQAAEMVGAKIAVPIHWGDIVGTEVDARLLVDSFPGKSQVLERGKEY
jgi:L-ascorbate metabolism protein UlaG (beta-lactamase superfamily)